jgi:hypothetical protein
MSEKPFELVLAGIAFLTSVVAWLRYPRHPDLRLAVVRFLGPIYCVVLLVTGLAGPEGLFSTAPDPTFAWAMVSVLVFCGVWAAHELLTTLAPGWYRPPSLLPRRRRPRHL